MDLDGVAALHVFDMDGTLLVGTTASRQIASMHGSEEQLLALERRFAVGEVDTRAFAVAIHQLWQDLRPEMVAAAFAASPWMTGVAEVCADIRARGEASVVITMSPDFFAGRLTVAVNADQHLAGLAASEYRGGDLFEAYRLGRAHLDPA